MEAILKRQRVKVLPLDKTEYQRIIVRRKHLWEDALSRFQSGINFHKHIRITFIGEPAVDEGGPLREFLRLLLGNIERNNSLFEGCENCRVPKPNMRALEKCTYQHIGEMVAVSLVHGGPSPTFFTPSIVDYIVYGMKKVKASVDEVPNETIVRKLKEVSLGAGIILCHIFIRGG